MFFKWGCPQICRYQVFTSKLHQSLGNTMLEWINQGCIVCLSKKKHQEDMNSAVFSLCCTQVTASFWHSCVHSRVCKVIVEGSRVVCVEQLHSVFFTRVLQGSTTLYTDSIVDSQKGRHCSPRYLGLVFGTSAAVLGILSEDHHHGWLGTWEDPMLVFFGGWMKWWKVLIDWLVDGCQHCQLKGDMEPYNQTS